MAYYARVYTGQEVLGNLTLPDDIALLVRGQVGRSNVELVLADSD